MSVCRWQLDHHRARLQLGSLSTAIDLSRPNRGMFDIQGGSPDLKTAEFLAIRFPTSRPQGPRPPLDVFVRQNELIADYSAAENWPIDVNARWIGQSASDRGLVAVWDLVLSVHTEHLDSRPAMAVVSRIPCVEALRLADSGTGRFVPLSAVSSSSQQAIDLRGGAGCMLLRLPKCQFSYVEMVHPVDFQHDEVCLEPHDGAGTVKVVHHLFVEPLEKGVILRARVRGALLPRENDCLLAAEAYCMFAAAEPPLGA